MVYNNDGPIYSTLTGTKDSCPEGYYRSNACADRSDAGYSPAFYSCSLPFQINCYTYTDASSGNTECVSYCDNV
jgi:hypothetical protein